MMVSRQLLDDLDNQQAVIVLSLVLERLGRLPDRTRLRELDEAIADAAADVAPELKADLPATPEPVSDQGLARAALVHLLAEQPELSSVVQQANKLSATDDGTRLEPITVGIGALVVLALQTDVKIERNTSGKWRFAVHKTSLKDSSLAALLSKLIAFYTGGN